MKQWNLGQEFSEYSRAQDHIFLYCEYSTSLHIACSLSFQTNGVREVMESCSYASVLSE